MEKFESNGKLPFLLQKYYSSLNDVTTFKFVDSRGWLNRLGRLCRRNVTLGEFKREIIIPFRNVQYVGHPVRYPY